MEVAISTINMSNRRTIKIKELLMIKTILKINCAEIALANKAGLNDLLKLHCGQKAKSYASIQVPEKEIVTYQISGIDILEIEDACQKLWQENIYAETGMGCTGPIILVSSSNADKAKEILNK
jgi:betaine reductase